MCDGTGGSLSLPVCMLCPLHQLPPTHILGHIGSDGFKAIGDISYPFCSPEASPLGPQFKEISPVTQEDFHSNRWGRPTHGQTEVLNVLSDQSNPGVYVCPPAKAQRNCISHMNLAPALRLCMCTPAVRLGTPDLPGS